MSSFQQIDLAVEFSVSEIEPEGINLARLRHRSDATANNLVCFQCCSQCVEAVEIPSLWKSCFPFNVRSNAGVNF